MQFAKTTKWFLTLTVSCAFAAMTANGALARGGGGGGHGGGGHASGSSYGASSHASGGWGNSNIGSVGGPGPTYAKGAKLGRGYGYGFGGGRRGYGYGYGYGGSGAAYNDGTWGNGPQWGNGGAGYVGGNGDGYAPHNNNVSGEQTVKTYSWPDTHTPAAQVQSVPYSPNTLTPSATKSTQSTLDNLIRDTSRF